MFRIQVVEDTPLEPGTSKPIYTNKVKLTFKREELLYDIKYLAFVEGDVMPTTDEHDRHQVMDIAEDGNIDRISRIISLVISSIREMLYPYTKLDVDKEEQRDDTLEAPEEYTINLKVPKDFSKTTIDFLEKLIHEFIVYKVLVDWLSITDLKNSTAVQNWAAKAEDIKDEINSTLYARMRRVRRRLEPS